jgi:uncharacterized protein
MASGSTLQINFLGGEPLLYPDTIQAIATASTEMAHEVGVQMRFAVVTNGTMLAEQKVQQLLLNSQMAVTVSVDGPPEVQDRFRPMKKGEGSSQHVEKGLEALQSIRKQLPSIGLSAVFHKNHLDVLATYEYFRRWDFDFYEFNYSHTEFDANASQSFVDGFIEVLRGADLAGGEDELRKIRSVDSLFLRLDEQVRALNFCGSGRSLLSMDARGDLFACPWDINDRQARLNTQVGVMAERGEQYQIPQVKKADCQKCWARNLCGGGCSYIHSQGNKQASGVDPFFCERTRSLIKTVIGYYEKYRRSTDEQH